MRFLRTAKHIVVLPYVSCFVPSLAFAVPCKGDIAYESASLGEIEIRDWGWGRKSAKGVVCRETVSRNHVSHLMDVRGTVTRTHFGSTVSSVDENA